MSVPVFQSYTPGVNDDINAKFKGLMNAYIETTQQLQWILQHLDSSNVTKLDTNRTTIRSQLGETVINGPLLVMKDKQPTPVIRLQMGYDPTSLDFIFNLMNAAGDVTVNIDSSGNLTVERGTFKGSITIGTGDNVFKVDANGMYLGDATFADAPFRVTMTGAATATNLTITGGTIRTAAAGNDRIELTGSGLTSYNGSNQKEGVAIETGLYGFSQLVLYVAGVLKGGLKAGGLNALNLESASGNNLNISSGNDGSNDDYIAGYWNCALSRFKTLKDENGYSYVTDNWVNSQGYLTETSGATGSFTTADGKTVMVADGLISSIL
jgi:hypothetical protein